MTVSLLRLKSAQLKFCVAAVVHWPTMSYSCICVYGQRPQCTHRAVNPLHFSYRLQGLKCQLPHSCLEVHLIRVLQWMGRENMYRKLCITKAGGRHHNRNAGVPSMNWFPACTNALCNEWPTRSVFFFFFGVLIKWGLHPLPLSCCFPPNVGPPKDKLH